MNKKGFLLASVCVMATLIISRAASHISSADQPVRAKQASEISKKYPYVSAREEAGFKAIAKLGDEGWEMVLKEPDKERIITPFYFKRRKQ
jgi:hypothetical protein